MNRSLLLRSSLLSALLGAALSASAVSISLSTRGRENSNSLWSIVHDTVIAQDGGYGSLGTLDYSMPASGSFMGMFSGLSGNLWVSFSPMSVIGMGSAQAMYGTWTAVGGTGVYTATSGNGVFGATFTFDDASGKSGLSQMSFAGAIQAVQAVPEPSAFAALGLGVTAMLRRRKKN